MATPPPTCTHIYLSQTIQGALPPLYFCASSLATPRTIARLESAYTYLRSHCHIRSYSDSRDVRALRVELEAGMSRERREQMQYYVLQIQDGRKRRATEVYLARYPGFVMYGDGRLDYGVAEVDVGENESVWVEIKKRFKEKFEQFKIMR